ncbi:MAG: hypothetical protein RMJ98_16030 [Myxococcales bacterium]|nr:hypothetical protein [Polyangiaceae bacterium]MDW8250806.1 hypothetical protein [Myxococcales bacterium]
MWKKELSVMILVALGSVACGEEDGGGADPNSAGKGTATFTTWGEEYIEEGIPAGGEGGFVDGWSVKFSKFLVVLGHVTVADGSGKEAAKMTGSRLVDHVKKGKKSLVSFPDLPAGAYEKVSYEILPADAQTELLGVDAADKDFMIENNYSVYVEGTATKEQSNKTFKWGFSQRTRYIECKAEQDGKETLGIVITSGGTDTSELTIHGDHFFYDRLQADPTGQIPTNLRFEALARADEEGDKNGEVTLDELTKAPIDLIAGYDPSGFSVTNMREFVTELTRTLGHFRGEGECTIVRAQ